jgi:class 3 adenylate cyclase
LCMTLREELHEQVKQIFRDQWETRNGTVVPEADDLQLDNDAVKLSGTILYADLAASTTLVDTEDDHFAAEVYKSYLYCAARIIRAEGGVITAYDGDRIMATYIGETKNTAAIRTGLKINWAVRTVVNPSLKAQYPQSSYEVKQTVGIDTSDLFVTRTGIRGSNDLVWVGQAANHAAKLTALPAEFPTRITKAVYDAAHKSVKTASDGRSMWEARSWTAMSGETIYRSNWWWNVE